MFCASEIVSREESLKQRVSTYRLSANLVLRRSKLAIECNGLSKLVLCTANYPSFVRPAPELYDARSRALCHESSSTRRGKGVLQPFGNAKTQPMPAARSTFSRHLNASQPRRVACVIDKLNSSI
ncbi:hypothetical protein SCHPADRAFT_911995 [Schizopora paradoxa]|uniref:Uncharacterized protein n=1 Tax=Schizopora paradoxa TaxID=27342 RepID=A0A0H2QVT7_9AGAM|nr:hypothetical protein SCHPADRAFT_911995 [Schizopora paradoxa]